MSATSKINITSPEFAQAVASPACLTCPVYLAIHSLPLAPPIRMVATASGRKDRHLEPNERSMSERSLLAV